MTEKQGINKKILLTDGNYKHTWAAAKTLALNDYLVDVVGGSRSIASKSKHVNKSVFRRNKLIDSNLHSFVELICEENYDLIIGIGASSIQFLSDNRNVISKYSKLLLPPSESLEFCLNKSLTIDLAKRIQVAVPESYTLRTHNELLAVSKSMNFPIIIKSTSESVKNYPTIYVDRYEDLSSKSVHEIFEYNDFKLVQERIFGVGEAFLAIYKDGVLIDYMMHERIREDPITGGPSTCARSIYREDLVYAGKGLLDELKWNGVAMVEFKRNCDGKIFLMEINPKFWGSLDLAISSGVDFPLLYAEIALRNLDTSFEYHASASKFQWPFDGDFKLALKHPKLMPSILLDFINPNVKKNIYLQDLSPTINGLLNRFMIFLVRFKLLKMFSSLSFKVNSEGLRFGFFRWITEITGIPLSRYSRVNDFLYIGGRLSKIGVYYLKFHRFKAILNLQSEFDDRQLGLKGLNYLHIKCQEFAGISIQDLSRGTEFIKSASDKKHKIYVHCAEGVGRAPTMASAFLISEGQELSTALSQVKRSRPFINILDSQICSLEDYAKH
jgi:predicted ATP-grasp superfamily ATP-dependent carboligase